MFVSFRSPRRGAEFVTRKVTLGAARIKLGLAADLRLGNLEARRDWERYVVVDRSLHRPAEVDLLCADPKKARVQLGWEPTVGFEELVAMMVEADVRLLSDGGDPEQDSSWP